MKLETYLRKKLVDEEVVLVDPKGEEYRFDGHEPRHESMHFCLKPKNGLVIQKSYEDIRHWEVQNTYIPTDGLEERISP